MEVKNTSYVTLQAFMVNDLKLSGNELIVYAVIYGFSQDGKSWFSGSRAYLAHWCQVSKRTVSTNLNKLVKKGLIEKRSRVENGVTFADYRAVQSAIPVVKNLHGVVKNLHGGSEESLSGGSEESSHHTIDTDIDREKIERNKPKKHRYGEYGHVLLTDDEFERLQKDLPDYERWIRDLDEYLEEHKNKSYSNHNLTIRKWKRREDERNEQKQLASQQQMGFTPSEQIEKWGSKL